MFRRFFIIGALLVYTSLSAQLKSNLIIKKVAVQDTIKLGDYSIIPSTFKVSDTNVVYQLDAPNALLITDTDKDSIEIAFQFFPIKLSRVYQDSIFKNVEENKGIPYEFQIQEQQNTNVDFGDVKYDGSISRGISVGNTRDLSLNSNLNLNMSGEIANDIKVKATINDQNIPFQPEGNTAQIQEFDQVFIELSKGNTELKLGDVFLRNGDDGYFLKYNRKGQGIKYNYSHTNDQLTEEHNYSFAVSKGKYNRYVMDIIEGNQGPYKLQGLNGERFIIVLSGTERIYIDGIQLERGEANDYVIDYNLGEVTFTANRLVNKDIRIQIEFEYSEQNFLRSITTGNSQYKQGPWEYGLQFFRDTDHKNQPILNEYGGAEKLMLSDVGDNIDRAIISAADSLGYVSDQIRYKLVDTFCSGCNGFTDDVYVYSNHPDSAHYQVSFSLVGDNKGDYIVQQELAGGRIYKWVDRLNNIPQGNYTPHIQLVAAEKKELYTANASRKIGEKGLFGIELARSNNDINTFSDSMDNDNVGYASLVTYQYESDSIGFAGQNWKVDNLISYELNTEEYKQLERFRPVEFTRNWNIQDVNNELHLIGNRWKASNQLTQLNYGIDYMNFQGQVNGVNQLYTVDQTIKNVQLVLEGTYLKKVGLENNTFNRPGMLINWTMPSNGWNLYAKRYMENNRMIEEDTLNDYSFLFIENSIGSSSPDTSRFNTSFKIRERKDYTPNLMSWDLLSQSWNFDINEKWRINQNNTVVIGFQYRDLEVYQSNTGFENDQSVLSRVEYFGRLLKRSLKTNIFYEVGSGLERKREYRFVKVQVGEGNYTWMDEDGDGLEELNEFRYDELGDAVQSGLYNNYIRVFTLGDEFVNTQNVSFTENIMFDPKLIFDRSSQMYDIIKVIQLQSNVRVQNKFEPTNTLADYNVLNSYNLFDLYQTIEQESIINNEISARNQIFLFRSNSKFGIQLVKFTNQRKDFLSTGFETRFSSKNKMAVRFRPDDITTINLDLTNGIKYLENKGFQTNSYYLDLIEYEPSYSLVFLNKYRLKASYKYAKKINDGDRFVSDGLDSTRGIFNNYSLQFRYFKSQAGNLNMKLSYVQVKYNTALNTPIAFAVLEGLQPGKNFVWGVGVDRLYKSNLQLNLSYDGRKSETGPIVHIGSMTLRYLF